MDTGDFVVLSPETLTSQDEQSFFAQKSIPEICHEFFFDDDILPMREKGAQF